LLIDHASNEKSLRAKSRTFKLLCPQYEFLRDKFMNLMSLLVGNAFIFGQKQHTFSDTELQFVAAENCHFSNDFPPIRQLPQASL
jgi:hypothetical protein